LNRQTLPHVSTTDDRNTPDNSHIKTL